MFRVAMGTHLKIPSRTGETYCTHRKELVQVVNSVCYDTRRYAEPLSANPSSMHCTLTHHKMMGTSPVPSSTSRWSH